MWPMQSYDHNLISFSFSPQALTCSWIEKTKNNTIPFILRAYKRHELSNYELENLILYNPTHIKQLIAAFLTEHKKNNAFISLSLSGPALKEHFITLPTSTPKATDFGIQQTNFTLWGYRYLYQNDAGQSVFYVYTLPRFVLLQYQLLAISTRLNVITITTESMALFNAYKHFFGNAYRRSQFGIDMMRHNNMPEQLISPGMLHRILTISPTIATQQDLPHLIPAYGLITLEGSFL